MATTGQKDLVLILGREFASNLATPMFVVDRDGVLVYYNEPAEVMVGRPFAQVGEVGALEWGASFQPEDMDGNPIDLEDMPPVVAFRRHRPDHRRVRITLPDGRQRVIAITGFPLFARADNFVGIVAIFWENGQGE